MTAESIRTRLAALPEPELPPALWPRLHLARVRQHERRRGIIAGSLAVLALIALPVVYTRIVSPSTPMPDLVTITPRAPLHEEPLRVLDRELQLAYQRGASEQELQWLWQRRQALARTGTTTAPPYPIEI
jgi:hypothetical protein